MNALVKALHERALVVAANYRRIEFALLEILEKLDEKKVFRTLGYSSLFQYALTELKLSESTAYNFITVARKSREFPEIKKEIKSGNLSVAKVKKVISVLEKNNASEWLEKAKTLPKSQLEKEVAKVSPQVLTPEKSNYVTEKRLGLQLGVEEELYEKLKRIKDLLSQKLRRSVTLEEALAAMADCYLEKNDPVEKAKRAQEKEKKVNNSEQQVPGPVLQMETLFRRASIPMAIKHRVVLRDQGQCVHIHSSGQRCENRRFLDFHHVNPVNNGGGNQMENLQLLCFNHHKVVHDISV